jgi:hypothetical protein
MGTYILRVESVFGATTGVWTTSPAGATDDAALAAAVRLAGSPYIFDDELAGASDAQIRFLTKYYLDGAGAPTEIGGLPAGFRILTAVAQVATSSIGGAEGSGYLQFLESQESPAFPSGGGGTFTFAYPGAMPSATDLYNNGVGIHHVTTEAHGGVIFDGLLIAGTYGLQNWWYSESLDDWQFGDDPGGDYAPDDHPWPYISSIVPDQGPTAGGTAVTITGGGFFNPDGELGVESVIFDGEFPGTDVVVIDQHTLTCVTPAHWKSTKHVVVNLDFDA